LGIFAPVDFRRSPAIVPVRGFRSAAGAAAAGRSAGRLLLTEAGRRVRSGEINRARERGYARWLGGAFVTNPGP
ncbi:hypothetical protein P4K96_22685, partial [Bacillus cereus]|nr:hypothetical protein [Bacillus cereus]